MPGIDFRYVLVMFSFNNFLYFSCGTSYTFVVLPAKTYKIVLEKINVSLVEKLKLNQWKNSDGIISWFKSIEEKQNCLFIQLDIMEFYPSITETVLDNAISFALQHTSIAEEDLRIIKHCRKSLLYNDDEPCKKKDTAALTRQ